VSRTKTKTIKGFAGLEYLTIINVPIRKSSVGDVVDMSLGELERVTAIALLENRVPIRGAEVKLFRSVLGFSLAALGAELGYKDTTILNWEKNSGKQLSLANEITLKLLVGERLGVELSPFIDELKSLEQTKKLKVSAA